MDWNDRNRFFIIILGRSLWSRFVLLGELGRRCVVSRNLIMAGRNRNGDMGIGFFWLLMTLFEF